MKLIVNLFALLIILFTGLLTNAEPLKAGVSIDSVPDTFFGSWRVVAKIDKQKGETYFNPIAIDLWNLSRQGNVINLTNPFTGASASVNVEYAEGNLIRFTKTGNYDGNKKLTDTVDLKLMGDTFTGINTLTLETYSNFDNSLIRKDSAIYILKGEKVSGESITGN